MSTRTHIKVTFFLANWLAIIQPAFSDDGIGEVRLGLEYAQRNCSSCHGIRKDDLTSPNSKATPFGLLAQTSGLTRTSLAVFLQTPHATMPNLVVKGEDADNIIAYILSLKEKTTR